MSRSPDSAVADSLRRRRVAQRLRPPLTAAHTPHSHSLVQPRPTRRISLSPVCPSVRSFPHPLARSTGCVSARPCRHRRSRVFGLIDRALAVGACRVLARGAMLDESMFEDIHEIAENSAYLRAVEEKDVSLEMYEQLPPYEQCREIEDKLRADNRLSFECIFNEPTGFYAIKTFLIADYAVDKAIFIKDVEAYKSMRFESARRKVAALLYQRFVSTDPEHEFKHGLSVFQIIQQSKGAEEKKERDGKVQPASINLSASPSHAQSLELKTVIPPASPLAASTANTSNGHTLAALQSPSALGNTLSVQHPHANGVTVGGPSPHAMHHSPITPSSPSHAAHTLLQMGSNNNPIGVYGKSVRIVREKVNRGEAPKDLFDEVARDVMTDLKLDAFPRFKQGDFYRRYIRTKAIETQKVQVKDFTTFRVLGRGGFGAVHACRKKNSGQIYAMKVAPLTSRAHHTANSHRAVPLSNQPCLASRVCSHLRPPPFALCGVCACVCAVHQQEAGEGEECAGQCAGGAQRADDDEVSLRHQPQVRAAGRRHAVPHHGPHAGRRPQVPSHQRGQVHREESALLRGAGAARTRARAQTVHHLQRHEGNTHTHTCTPRTPDGMRN